MKQHILYRTLTALFALCALTLAVLGVIALIPSELTTGLSVKETIAVSSSPLDNVGRNYVSQIQGTLINSSDEEIEVDGLIIEVSDGQHKKKIVLDGFKLPPRVTHTVLYEWEDSYYFSRVEAVLASDGDSEERLPNLTSESPFDFSALILFALCAVFALITVHFAKQCYYLLQEDEIKKSLSSDDTLRAQAPTDPESND